MPCCTAAPYHTPLYHTPLAYCCTLPYPTQLLYCCALRTVLLRPSALCSFSRPLTHCATAPFCAALYLTPHPTTVLTGHAVLHCTVSHSTGCTPVLYRDSVPYRCSALPLLYRRHKAVLKLYENCASSAYSERRKVSGKKERTMSLHCGRHASTVR